MKRRRLEALRHCKVARVGLGKQCRPGFPQQCRSTELGISRVQLREVPEFLLPAFYAPSVVYVLPHAAYLARRSAYSVPPYHYISAFSTATANDPHGPTVIMPEAHESNCVDAHVCMICFFHQPAPAANSVYSGNVTHELAQFKGALTSIPNAFTNHPSDSRSMMVATLTTPRRTYYAVLYAAHGFTL